MAVEGDCLGQSNENLRGAGRDGSEQLDGMCSEQLGRMACSIQME